MLAKITGMTCSRVFPLLALPAVFAVSAGAQTWSIRSSGIDTNLRGVSAPGDGHEGTVWVSGSNGVVMVTSDVGKRWKRLRVKGGEDLDFRGVVAFNESKAYLMSSGEGAKSRIYKTTDGGASWRLEYSDERKEFFLDALQCLSETDCYALGDPLDGRFVILHTRDGERCSAVATVDGRRLVAVGTNGSDSSDDHGQHWKPIDSGSWNALTVSKSGAWAVGAKGTVARFE